MLAVGGNPTIWRLAAAKQAALYQLICGVNRTAAAARQIAGKPAPTPFGQKRTQILTSWIVARSAPTHQAPSSGLFYAEAFGS
ncbi:hypothetical protein J3P77_18055 [Pseudomonas sp. R1-18]|uniref:hypothetical protein n=1 Tax=Pseudomonas sp. R1-18 TaxID=1632772 RepID=UPI003DA98C9C